MDCYWNRNTVATIGELCRASKGVAILPLASIESHGPHLPLGSDTHCIEHLIGMVLEKETAAVLPTVEYSYVASARALPGAIHIRSDILMDVVENICDEIHRNGFTKVVLLHGHGGNLFLGQAFVKRMQEREKPFSCYAIPVLPGITKEVNELMETEYEGKHAGEFETSLNMAACPDLVNLDVIGDKTFPEEPGPQVQSAFTNVDWISKHPEMAVGEPQKATKEKGAQFAKLWADSIINHLRLIKEDTVVPETVASYINRVNSIGKDI